jgi:deoxyribonuclease V
MYYLTENKKQKLRKIQNRIAKKVILEDEFSKPIKTIAGFDLAFLDDDALVAGVVLDYKNLKVIEIKILKTHLDFPYIPTFLSFREGPPIIKLYKKLKTKPDIIIINGHGIAHPLFCGIASYVGVLLDKPTIGVAQSKLCGNYNEPKKFDEYSQITYKKRIVGYVYKSKKNCRPIFISPGHGLSLKSFIKIVKKCIKTDKLPLPLAIAHIQANKSKTILKDIEK